MRSYSFNCTTNKIGPGCRSRKVFSGHKQLQSTIIVFLCKCKKKKTVHHLQLSKNSATLHFVGYCSTELSRNLTIFHSVFPTKHRTPLLGHK